MLETLEFYVASRCESWLKALLPLLWFGSRGDGITLSIFYPLRDFFCYKFYMDWSKVPKLFATDELFWSLPSLMVWLFTFELAAFVVMLVSADPLWSLSLWIRLEFDWTLTLMLLVLSTASCCIEFCDWIRSSVWLSSYACEFILKFLRWILWS